MSAAGPETQTASLVAALLAIDPLGLGGVHLRGRAGPHRDAWLAGLQSLAQGRAWCRLPPGTAPDRLLGGLDLASTLACARPVKEAGLLAKADGGFLLAPLAERLDDTQTGPLAAALDGGSACEVQSDGAAGQASRFALLLLDEGVGDEAPPTALLERVAFCCDLDVENAAKGSAETAAPAADAARIAVARAGLVAVEASDEIAAGAAAIGPAFGLPSLRIATFLLRAARAHAALAGRTTVAEEDLAAAAAVVIAPRATQCPAPPPAPPAHEEDDQDAREQQELPPDRQADTPDHYDAPASSMVEHLVEATAAAIPPNLLAALAGQTNAIAKQKGRTGRAGALRQATHTGRPIGTRAGKPGRGARLALVETLRAAAPWQPLRQRTGTRIEIRREDLRVSRLKRRRETTTLFVVDASGSAALARLAEVKGAIELILADCYIRRDSVGLIAFRNTTAELVLPPTRSLARAKRALAGQVGGGATPLATAIDAALALADAQRRRGSQPLVVLLTDGRGNIARSGRADRQAAEADTLAAGRALGAAGIPALLVDIAPRPQPAARALAEAMQARYYPLPFVDGRALSNAVIAAGARGLGSLERPNSRGDRDRSAAR